MSWALPGPTVEELSLAQRTAVGPDDHSPESFRPVVGHAVFGRPLRPQSVSAATRNVNYRVYETGICRRDRPSSSPSPPVVWLQRRVRGRSGAVHAERRRNRRRVGRLPERCLRQSDLCAVSAEFFGDLVQVVASAEYLDCLGDPGLYLGVREALVFRLEISVLHRSIFHRQVR